ncbi:hybrid sensor histidine kinase/response regulator [Pseudomonas syringae group genomosp. 3]|uniref:hybrid sensor histidine kinase/response regulator n=1 Tax=Pseudomonas syringae group genomosp. 3 TaxID=251701 RepID=UPI0006E67702|nr:hybrid sensor histidine kinase/response regulator [Pseudomonas syringae group genomosp. 3]KPW58158.1 Sensor histidine kinase/response regulator [Pseudomonas syringae pv. berberidis]KPY21277.1 Sensor histidine kinase/response regulator [Pseudomonas syringae pv. philadelphi]RMM22692.1 Sensor histidine kinase/response regulator [Pseudomonas syringae pv. berberidis]RMP62440.1 Sensor histidine kinase/response regulator [Pseudomonas syringae pv. berberidis]RMQ43967.1 Sensor histidine kinase/respo
MTPDQMRDASLFELFTLEADAQTQVLSAGLLALERNPTQADQLEACMRAAHSLKGAARIVGVDFGVSVAHVMEDCLVSAQEGRLLLQAEHIDALLAGTDLLMRVATPGGTSVGQADIDSYVERLNTLLASGAGAARTVTKALTDPLLDPLLASAMQQLELSSAAAAALTGQATDSLAAGSPPGPVPAPAEPAAEPEPPFTPLRERRVAEGGERVLRVTAERLNGLLDMSSKSLVETQRLKPLLAGMQRLKRLQSSSDRALEVLGASFGEDGQGADVQKALEDARSLLSQAQHMLAQQTAELDEFGWQSAQRAQLLYDTALACRMRPFADVLNGQARMVRDLGRELGKQVRLQIEGEKTQVDRDVLEKLEAPLTHLLRNAVDHGIELPEKRAAAGKEPEGLIRLQASHQAGLLVVELSDDGGGVDLARLRQSIVDRKLSPAETAEQMSEEELLSFLFLPGFSMRDKVTQISGRGVGLDAVQHMVRQMHGSVQLQQWAGEGSRFRIEMPLTLSVVRSLVVEVGGEAYAFPLAHIERMRDLQPDDILQLEGRQHFWDEERHVGLVSASQLLNRPPAQNAGETTLKVVVIRERDAVYGVAVERFIGERTLVVMPLDARLCKVQDVSAGALLDDGSVVLIVDVEDMLRSVEKLLNTGRLERIDRRNRQVDQATRKRVLVVDDSLTVRELERKLLVGRGYDVSVAVDGMDGWNALRAEDFDLLITDIDMPRMDGIELVTLLRRDTRLQSLPVMVVSYKDREEDRRRGLDAGADYYLAKASFHDDALLDAVVELIGDAQG